ncbi:DUF4224 domain-containing protein [Xylella fastidiosa subsp. sandyi]|uniref:DUF4224 domain-containing protein n=1 Tax=Xylella fastidiosa subsp. sandyi Ann-1 TaxID=155920 RepID=A0A060HD99_XYLFS|nr:DUF4224 domain-containing protein [Xylella fastidiosa]AIC11361.1 hypothetical protein D934_08350 [Xylella fastidiosa subsp. sandyi Ann-1]RWA43586.1 DUF4224 domain-containing protein [Xylella fastidiosa subsp. sandyi]UIX82132.1 DUF4224 domain-containing protein [Xylella fastidiosa subsp. sandyi]WNY18586.1 DUF4224 domain-containing protein [Xylella fastidiosa]WNY20873.1 DUF4224 domain-containing protein [Xylella fastidiosa]
MTRFRSSEVEFVSNLWLSPEEVTELTARKKWAAQTRALISMGIPFKPNAVGRPLVERAAVMSTTPTASPRRKATPNWNALHKVA